jgi:hypothetical protein
MARKRLRRMKFPTTTNEIKKIIAKLEKFLEYSYMTLFQSSPIKTMKIVTTPYSNVSKFARICFS